MRIRIEILRMGYVKTTVGQKNLPRYFAQVLKPKKNEFWQLDFELPDGRKFRANGKSWACKYS